MTALEGMSTSSKLSSYSRVVGFDAVDGASPVLDLMPKVFVAAQILVERGMSFFAYQTCRRKVPIAAKPVMI